MAAPMRTQATHRRLHRFGWGGPRRTRALVLRHMQGRGVRGDQTVAQRLGRGGGARGPRAGAAGTRQWISELWAGVERVGTWSNGRQAAPLTLRGGVKRRDEGPVWQVPQAAARHKAAARQPDSTAASSASPLARVPALPEAHLGDARPHSWQIVPACARDEPNIWHGALEGQP